MPPKTVICSVCSAEVLKAQTLARLDGTRACRVHDGVAAEAERLAVSERAKRTEAVAKGSAIDQWVRERRVEYSQRDADFWKNQETFREYVHNHCWVCSQEGISLQEFFAQALVAMKRLELRREFNFMTMPEDVRKLMGGQRALAQIPLKGEVIDKAVVKHVKDKRVRDLVPLVRFVLFCAECANKHGFKARWDDLLPKPTWEQIEAMGPVVAALDPVLREMAEKKEGQS